MVDRSKWWLNLFLGIKQEKRLRKRQSHDDKRHLLERQKWPRVYKAIQLAHVVERTQALCNKSTFGVFLKARHVLDACIHIHMLKFLVEAAC